VVHNRGQGCGLVATGWCGGAPGSSLKLSGWFHRVYDAFRGMCPYNLA
jgi:hypothetical protein